MHQSSILIVYVANYIQLWDLQYNIELVKHTTDQRYYQTVTVVAHGEYERIDVKEEVQGLVSSSASSGFPY